ncbi:MAG TPA: PQQ-dependent sugar dehydrogenase [Gammaproteobacteria bacterium]
MHGIRACTLATLLTAACIGGTPPALAQRASSPPLGEGPWILSTAEGEVRVSVLARGLEHPWALAFLPDGTMLVTERVGRLRVIRDGRLEPQPVAGMPEVSHAFLAGLMDLALHPRFAVNGWVYFTYSKPTEEGVANAIGRGRWDGEGLVGIEDVFVADSFGMNRGGASRIAFDGDGHLFMTVGGAGTPGDMRAQDPRTHVGKVLRLTDEGGVPASNPFVGREGYAPEVYSLGHRNQTGLAFHPETGELYASEHGPLGGDEINIIRPGRNYGWPIVTYGRNYDGSKAAELPWRADLEEPWLFWVPSIAPTGMTFYTGQAFPAWRGQLFVGGLIEARFAPSGQVQRIVSSEHGEIGREPLLRELRQRIRGVYQGPDDLLYVLTDEVDGAVLVLDPG